MLLGRACVRDLLVQNLRCSLVAYLGIYTRLAHSSACTRICFAITFLPTAWIRLSAVSALHAQGEAVQITHPAARPPTGPSVTWRIGQTVPATARSSATCSSSHGKPAPNARVEDSTAAKNHRQPVPPPRLLGVPYRRIARATGSRSPQAAPARGVWASTQLHTAGYSVPWTRTPPEPLAGPAHRALRPRHAPSSIGDPMGERLPRSPAACSGASPVGASPVAFPPSRSPPP